MRRRPSASRSRWIYSREDDMTMDFARAFTFQKTRRVWMATAAYRDELHDVSHRGDQARVHPDFRAPSVDRGRQLASFTFNGAGRLLLRPRAQPHVRASLNEMAHTPRPQAVGRSCAGWTFWAVESMIASLPMRPPGDAQFVFRIALLTAKGKNAGGAQRLLNTLLAAMGCRNTAPRLCPG